MGVYTSSIGDQLQRFEANVKRMVRGAMLQGARRFRSRMMRERLSGPPGVYKKTGALRRSLITGGKSLGLGVLQGSGHIRYRAQIGGTMAPHADKHEQSGKLAFRNTFAEEARNTVDAIRTGFQFLAKGTDLGDILGFVAPDVDIDRSAAATEVRRRFNPRTSNGRRNIKTGIKAARKYWKNKARREQLEASGLAPYFEERLKRYEGLLERGRQSQLRGRRSRGGKR